MHNSIHTKDESERMADKFKDLEKDALTKSPTVQSTVTVAIIGSAGRNEDGAKMNAAVFDAMTAAALRTISDVWRLDTGRVRLVSGGAAWADHVAVRLFLEGIANAEFDADGDADMKAHCVAPIFAGLTLYLPCDFDFTPANPHAVETASVNNPGKQMNKLHAEFSRKLGRSTLLDLLTAKHMGAEMDVEGGGFHARNARVARSDFVLAMTWGDSKDGPKEGGTKHTWDLARTGSKLHLPIGTIMPLPDRQ